MARRAPSPNRLRVAIAAAVLGSSGCPSREGGPGGKPRPLPSVVVAQVEARDVAVEARAPVDLRPLSLAELGSKTVGYLDAVLVDRGDRVKRGQLLAVVRPSDLPDQLEAARNQLGQARAARALSVSRVERLRSLAPQRLVSTQELQAEEAGLAGAEAAEATATAQMAALATRLGETRIVSPIDGVVWQRRLDAGALVGQQSGGAILSVADVSTLRAFVAVNEQHAGRVSVGQEAWVELDALPGRRVGGRVARVAPGFDPGTRTLEVEVRIDNAAGALKPGMYGRGHVVLETRAGAAVAPIGAVASSGGRHYVFVIEGDVAKRREIAIGVDGGDWVEARAGLAAGEEVVVAGADALADGSKVRVVRGVDPFSGRPRPPAPGPDGGGAR